MKKEDLIVYVIEGIVGVGIGYFGCKKIYELGKKHAYEKINKELDAMREEMKAEVAMCKLEEEMGES